MGPGTYMPHKLYLLYSWNILREKVHVFTNFVVLCPSANAWVMMDNRRQEGVSTKVLSMISHFFPTNSLKISPSEDIRYLVTCLRLEIL